MKQLVLGLVLLTACTGVHAPILSDRALSRGSLETFEDVWLESARACVNSGVMMQSKERITQCQEILVPIKAELDTADSALDTWAESDRQAMPCLIKSMMIDLTESSNKLLRFGLKAPAMLADAVELATPLSAQCKSEFVDSKGGIPTQ